MTTDRILDKAVRREPLTRDEAYALYECTPTPYGVRRSPTRRS